MNIWSIIIKTWSIMAVMVIVVENMWNLYLMKKLMKDDPWNGPKTLTEFVREFHELFFSKGFLQGVALLTASLIFNYLAWPFMVYMYCKNPMLAIEAFTMDDNSNKEDEP